MSTNGFSHKYGAVEPHDNEEGRDLTETKNVLRVGGARSKLLEDAHPRTSLLAASKRDNSRTTNQLREFLTKDRLVALVIWLAVLVFIILIVIRIVHVEKQKHKHHT